MKRLQVLRSALAGGASVLALVHPAMAKEFDIPHGDLSAVLGAYVQQSDVQIVYVDDLVRGHRSAGAKGNYTEIAALTQLLRGTGFTTTATSSNAIEIVHQAPVQLAQAAPRRATAPAVGGAVETVVVTAQRAREDIQTVPIAVTAMSQKDLTQRQVATGGDLIREVPNMNFGKTNFSGYSIELRGIGTQAISVTTDPAVAVAFNGIPFIRNHFFEQEFYDVDDVEVLRGPQGTLWGRNATAGVVNLSSAKPTGDFDMISSVDIGNYSNRRLEGMINIPIVDDKLDLRLAGEWTKRDGYTEDTTLDTSVDGRDLWSGRASLRFHPTEDFDSTLVWEHFSEDDDRLRSGKQLCETAPSPTTIDGVNVAASQGMAGMGAVGPVALLNSANTSQGCQATSLYAPTAFQVPNGAALPLVVALQVFGLENFGTDPYASTTQSTNLRSIQSALLPTYKAKNDTLEYNADFHINSALTLSSQTGFNQDYLWSTEDYNRFDTTPGVFNGSTLASFGALFSPGGEFIPPGSPVHYLPPNSTSNGGYVFCDPQLGCSASLVTEDLSTEHAWQLSQELRLASNFSGPFNFSLGGNYLHYETDERYYVFANALTAYSLNSGANDPATSGFPGGHGSPNCLLANNRFDGGYQTPNPKVPQFPAYACVDIDWNPIGSLDNQGHNYFQSQNPYTLNSYAVFGEAYYNITDTLKLTGGIRWTVDQKSFTEIPSELLNAQSGFWVSGVEKQEWDRPTGRAVIDWTPDLDFSDHSLFYASYAHGYKAGGANPPGAVYPVFSSVNGPTQFVDHPLTFKPEYIEAFELGSKNAFLDNTLTVNADVFYYNYTGYQISEIVDRTAINNNYNAHVEGAELESTWEPEPGWRFNFAGGWEQTGIAGGTTGIDLMDRTAGMPGWMVIKPFVTESSNCILPTYVVAALLTEQASGAGQAFACDHAYSLHVDPVTGLPYVPNPTGSYVLPGPGGVIGGPIPTGYPGFDPTQPIINNGEGFAKNLAGNKLPNAPPFTVSFGSEYTTPISPDWAATLRGDVYWQANSWARVFNDRPYDVLHGYSNLNLSLVFNSSDGLQIMAYVKNVFDTTAITGDFLNSDDSGLTTNVFLTDPRLFGIRVTKDFSAGGEGNYGIPDFFTNLFSDTDGGKPSVWIDIGGQMEGITGQGSSFIPPFLQAWNTSSILQQKITPQKAMNPPPNSFGEEASISYQPADSDWVLSASIRYGRSGNSRHVNHQTTNLPPPSFIGGVPQVNPNANNLFSVEKFVTTVAKHNETHSILDFMAGKDVGLGMFGLDGSSTLSAGVRIAQFSSQSSMDMRARPDLHFKYIPSNGAPTRTTFAPYFHSYHATSTISRSFHGIGPSISWNNSTPVAGGDDASLTVDWSANAAILFGRQRTHVLHSATGRNWPLAGAGLYSNSYLVYQKTGGHDSDRTVTVPNLGGSIGASYSFKNAKISFGYRGDFFLDALDGGIDGRKPETLGFFGPFAKISLGLGG